MSYWQNSMVSMVMALRVSLANHLASRRHPQARAHLLPLWPEPAATHNEALEFSLAIPSLLTAPSVLILNLSRRLGTSMKENKAPTQKSFSFGGCDIAQTSPDISKLNPTTQVLNVRIGFEDALKLHLAIGECVRKLNSYKRSTSEGKRTALNLAIHLDKNRITVNEGRLPGKLSNIYEETSRDEFASRNSFKNEPMPDKRAPLPLTRRLSNEEFAQIQKGFVPQSMDDHWFIYFDTSTNQLFMHRSWTGFCIYILKFAQMSNGWEVTASWVNRDTKQYEATDDEHDGAVALWLIDILLLGKERDFPST